MRFSNRTMIVTGGAGGIGLAIGKRFYDEGANVVLADINDLSLKKAGESMGREERIMTVVCDVSKEEQVKAAIDNTISRFQSVDIVVNNAGLMIFKKLEEHTTEDWQKILSIDLMGAFYFIKY